MKWLQIALSAIVQAKLVQGLAKVALQVLDLSRILRLLYRVRYYPLTEGFGGLTILKQTYSVSKEMV